MQGKVLLFHFSVSFPEVWIKWDMILSQSFFQYWISKCQWGKMDAAWHVTSLSRWDQRLTRELWDLGDGDWKSYCSSWQQSAAPAMQTIIALDLSHSICIHLAAVFDTSLWCPESLCAGSESRTSAEQWMTLFLCAAFLSPPVTLPGALCVCLSTRDRNNKERPNKRMTLCFPSAPERQNGEEDQHRKAPVEHRLMGKVHLEFALGNLILTFWSCFWLSVRHKYISKFNLSVQT